MSATRVAAVALAMVAVGCVTSRAEGDQLRNDVSTLKSEMAQLQRQDGDERAQARARLDAIAQRVTTLEQTLAGLRQADADGGVQLEKIVAEVQALRGEVEQQRHQLGETSASVASILARPPVSVAAAASAPKLEDASKPATIAGKEVPADAPAHYDMAKRLYDDKKFAEAAEAFELFLQRHEKSDKANNAAFWKAESFFGQAGTLSDQKAKEGALKKAILAYQRVLETPKSDKGDSALWKIGQSFEQLGFKDEAVVFYEELTAKHEKSPLVKDAKARLKALGAKKKKNK
jgi:TolA-binding protein